jgi:hypothetical protein
MAAKGQALTLCYVAWDTSANAGKTGDAGNHTLRWVKDGTSAAPTNAPSEVDATNAPRRYKLTLTAAECDCWLGVLAGKSSTANVSLVAVVVSFELAAAAIAQAVLSCSAADVEATAGLATLCAVILAAFHSDTTSHANKLTIFKTTGAEFAQKTLAAAADAAPITGIS